MLKKQSGMTLVSWMVAAAFFGALGLVVLKLIPVYMNYGSVKSIMDEMTRDDKIKGQTPKDIRRMLYSRLEVNGLSGVSSKKGAFKFTRIDRGYKMNLDYEVRENLIGNLDYIVVFDYEVDLETK